MSMWKEYIKIAIPAVWWPLLREWYLSLLHVLEKRRPFVCSMVYDGFTVYFGRGNSLIARLKQEPVFEESMCNRIISDLQKSSDPVFVDVGANIGLITTSILKGVPQVKVYAFEPGPLQASFLQKTIDENRLEDRVSLNVDALSDVSGTQSFFIHPSRDYAKDGLRDTGRGEKAHSIQVTVTTLDSWWETQGRPQMSVVKIDTEGAELFILRGAVKCIEVLKPVFYLEIEPSNLKVYPYGAEDIRAFFESVGYSLETLTGERVSSGNFSKLLDTNDTFRASSTIHPLK